MGMQAKSKKKKQAGSDSEGEFSDAQSDEDFAPKKVGFSVHLSMTLLILVCVMWASTHIDIFRQFL